MIFTNRNKNDIRTKLALNINNYSLLNVEFTKFLGIWVDKELSWKLHINSIATKISSYIGVFARICQFLPSFILKLLYQSLIYPHLIYGITIWGNSSIANLNKIFILQKKVIRIIMKANYNAHTTGLFKALNLLKLHDLYVYAYHVNLYTFEIKNNLMPNNFQLILFNCNEDHNLRNQGNVLQKYCRTMTRKKFITFAAVHIWNDLPTAIKQASTLSLFKRNILNHFINNY